MELEVGIEGFELPEEIGIKIEAQIGVVAALEEELVAAEQEQFVNFFFVFLDGGGVRLGMAGAAIEVAELAIGDAHIGGVGIAVYDPGDDIVGHMMLPEAVADVHQL